jgi:cation/acetate symporter
VVLAMLGPAFMGADALFPIVNPAVASVPIGFLGAILGALLSRRDPVSEAQFDEVIFRANTGLRDDAPAAAESH